MTDIALTNGDLPRGDWALVEGADALRQRLEIRLRKWVDEWFLNPASGTNYPLILGKGTDARRTAEIRRVIVETSGVASILRLQLDHNRAARSLAVSAVVQMEDGEALALSLTLHSPDDNGGA